MFDFVTKIGVTYFRFPSPAPKKDSTFQLGLFCFWLVPEIACVALNVLVVNELGLLCSSYLRSVKVLTC